MLLGCWCFAFLVARLSRFNKLKRRPVAAFHFLRASSARYRIKYIYLNIYIFHTTETAHHNTHTHTHAHTLARASTHTHGTHSQEKTLTAARGIQRRRSTMNLDWGSAACKHFSCYFDNICFCSAFLSFCCAFVRFSWLFVCLLCAYCYYIYMYIYLFNGIYIRYIADLISSILLATFFAQHTLREREGEMCLRCVYWPGQYTRRIRDVQFAAKLFDLMTSPQSVERPSRQWRHRLSQLSRAQCTLFIGDTADVDAAAAAAAVAAAAANFRKCFSLRFSWICRVWK